MGGVKGEENYGRLERDGGSLNENGVNKPRARNWTVPRNLIR